MSEVSAINLFNLFSVFVTIIFWIGWWRRDVPRVCLELETTRSLFWIRVVTLKLTLIICRWVSWRNFWLEWWLLRGCPLILLFLSWLTTILFPFGDLVIFFSKGWFLFNWITCQPVDMIAKLASLPISRQTNQTQKDVEK